MTYKGNLFSSHFLEEGIGETPEWQHVRDADFNAFKQQLIAIFSAFPTAESPNEAHTDQDLIFKVIFRKSFKVYFLKVYNWPLYIFLAL